MRKVIAVLLFLCLCVPAIGYAGSATSRWDLTIGGVIKIDMGWSEKAKTFMNSAGAPGRDDLSGSSTVNNHYGNWLWGGGETGLNLNVRGPETWGAKTSAMMGLDFTGNWAYQTTYGTATLTVASMHFDWPNTTLVIGAEPALFGMIMTQGQQQLTFGGYPMGDGAAAPTTPQVTVTQRFGKNWSAGFGVLSQHAINSQTNSLVSGAGADSYARGPYPGIHGLIKWTSPVLGKVGPWQLQFATSGFYSKEKRTYNPTPTSVADTNLDMWDLDFKWLVPIIPEQNNGNKTGALFVDGIFFALQDMGDFTAGAGAYNGIAPYDRNTLSQTTFSTNPNFADNLIRGGSFHVAYNVTDALRINGWAWYSKIDPSRAYQKANPAGVDYANGYIVNLMYDLSPAIRFGLQWNQMIGHYNGRSPTTATTAGSSNYGKINIYRFGAFYFF